MPIQPNKQRETDIKPTFLAIVICTLASAFYLYDFILQVYPTVLTQELSRDLGLNAIGLGLLASFYFYSYTIMQLPAGFLYDHFGPRFLMSSATFTCAAGTLIFALTHSLVIASLGRLMMGIGSAFSFIGSLILVSRWLPARHFAFLAGLIQMMSCIGAIVGETPFRLAINQWGWRSTMVALAIIGMVLGLLIWLVVRDSPHSQSVRRVSATRAPKRIKNLIAVCRNPQTWYVAFYSFMVWAPITAFAILWGIPFLVVSYGLSTEAASAASTLIWVAIGVGCPLLGWYSEKLRRRGGPLQFAASLGIMGLVPVIYVPHLPLFLLYVFLFLLGLAASGQSLAFGVVKDNNPVNQVGTAMGINNMATVAGGALFQPLIGLCLQHYWGGVLQHGIPFYSAANYRKAFILLPLCYLLAFLVSKLLIKETHCQLQYHYDN